MKLKIYYEYIVILNFLLDFMILYGTKRILKRKQSIIRLLLASLFGAMTTILLFVQISSFELFFIKIIFSIIMILIGFGKNDFFHNIFYFYIMSIIVGGSVYLFDLRNSSLFYYIGLLCVSCGSVFIFVYEYLQYQKVFHHKYCVTIIYHKKKYLLEGFIDTGNRLVSPIKKESVILVNLSFDMKQVIYVPYKALNTSGVIPCIRPDKVIINKREFHHCLIGISKDKFDLNGMNCILPNIFKEELC